MKKFLFLSLLVLSQVGFAQKMPLHYKIVQKTDQNGDLSEQTYYLSIHETKEKIGKQKILELRIDGMEDIDLMDSTLSYSSIKTEDMGQYLSSSTNLFHLMRSYLPIRFTIQKQGLVIDSAGFHEKLAQISDEFALKELFTDRNIPFFYARYRTLLNDIYFFDLSDQGNKRLKQTEIDKSGFKYKIIAQNKKDWIVEKSRDDSSKVLQTIQFNPKTNLTVSKSEKFENVSEIDGQPFKYAETKILSREKDQLIKIPSAQYYEMIIKGSHWSRYFKFNQEVDNVKFQQYISDYKNEFGSDINYLKTVLSGYQTKRDYESYDRELIKIPSKKLANTHHLRNKVQIDDLSDADFLETVSLLSDDQLYDYLQSGLSQGVKANRQESLARMTSIYSSLSDREKRAIGPMIIWANNKDSQDNKSLQEGIDKLYSLTDSDWKQGNVGRYLIMLIQAQFANGRTDLSDYDKLQTRLKVLADDRERAKKLINKAHLAHINFLMFEALKERSPEEAMNYLKQAYALSAKTSQDYEYQSFYDQHFTGSKQDYTADYLAELGDQYGKDRVLQEYIAEFSNSPAKNYAMLKKFYHENYDQSGFAEFLKKEAFTNLQPAPAFLLEDLEGGDIAPSQFKGKWTFIDFWGTWCGPCVAELPEFNSLYEKKLSAMTDKLMVLTIACYDEKADVTAFMTKNNYKFPVLISDGQVQKDYKVSGYPSKALITPDGKLIPIEFGQDWKWLLDEFLLHTPTT